MLDVFRRAGSFAQRIIRDAFKTGRSLAETVGILRPIAPDITEPQVVSGFGKVRLSEELSTEISKLSERTVIPESLMQSTDIPFSRPYAYKVVIFGRWAAGTVGPGGERIGGQFAKQEFDLPVSRPLTIAEIKEMAAARLGQDKSQYLSEIFDIAVTNAYYREGEF